MKAVEVRTAGKTGDHGNVEDGATLADPFL